MFKYLRFLRDLNIMHKCQICNRTYSTSGNLKRHQKKPCKIKKTEWQCEHCGQYYAAKCSLKKHMESCDHVAAKKKLILKPKIRTRTRIQIQPQPLHRPRSQIKKTPTRLQMIVHGPALAKQPVVFDDILGKLTEKLGTQEAVSFLLTNFLSKNLEKIISTCYLDGISAASFPIACSGGNHFRFLDENGIVIDDPTGDKLVKKIINNLQNALLRSNYLLIKKYIGEGDTSALYDVYDIKTIQDGIYDLFKQTNHNKIKRYLSKRMLNPNHFFFPQTSANVNY